MEGADRTLPRLRPPVSAVPSSAFGGLQDQPSPSGKLADRIERLRQKCMEALGRDTFIEAYLFLKKHDQVDYLPFFYFDVYLSNNSSVTVIIGVTRL